MSVSHWEAKRKRKEKKEPPCVVGGEISFGPSDPRTVPVAIRDRMSVLFGGVLVSRFTFFFIFHFFRRVCVCFSGRFCSFFFRFQAPFTVAIIPLTLAVSFRGLIRVWFMSLGSANAALKSIQLPIFFDSLFRPYSGSSVQCRSDFRGSLFFNSKTNSMVTWFRLDSYSTFRSLVSSGRVNEVSIKTALVVAWDRIPLPSWLPFFFLGGGAFWFMTQNHPPWFGFEFPRFAHCGHSAFDLGCQFFFFQLRKRIWGWFLPVPLNRSGSNSSSIFRQRSGGDRCIGFSLLQLRCWVAFCFPFSDRFPYFSPREQKKTKQNNNAIARSSHQHGSRWHRRPLDVLLRFLGFFFLTFFLEPDRLRSRH